MSNYDVERAAQLTWPTPTMPAAAAAAYQTRPKLSVLGLSARIAHNRRQRWLTRLATSSRDSATRTQLWVGGSLRLGCNGPTPGTTSRLALMTQLDLRTKVLAAASTPSSGCSCTTIDTGPAGRSGGTGVLHRPFVTATCVP